MLKNYKELLTQNGSTWQNAIKTYHDFFKVDLSKYFDISEDLYALPANSPFILEDLKENELIDLEYYLLNLHEQNKKTSKKYVLEFKDKFNIGIPAELQDLYINHGGFNINECEGFAISPLREHDYFHSEFSNYAYSEAFTKETDTLSEEEPNELLKRFYFFGVGFYESGADAIIYYYDHQEKYYGEVDVLPSECPKMKETIFPALFNARLSRYTFDELVCKQVDRYLLQKIIFNYDAGFLDDENWEKILNEKYKN